MLFKNMISELKCDNFKRIIIELILLVLLFNVNMYLGIAIFALLLLELIFSKDNNILLYSFIFLSFNDEILKLDILRGSISRIVMVVLILKLLLNIFKHKIKVLPYQFGILMFFVVSTVIGIVMGEGIISSLISFLNIFVIVLFSIVLGGDKNFDMDLFVERLSRTIIISVLCGIFYGLGTVNFLKYVQDGEIVYRFNGSYEPNFMCMYINLAILSLITIHKKFNIIIYYILMAFLINMNILTASMTGLLSFTISIVFYFFLFIKDWKVSIRNIALIAFITVILFSGFKMVKVVNDRYYIGFDSNIDYNISNEANKKDNKVNHSTESIIDDTGSDESDAITHRFKRIGKMLSEGKIDEITSGRTALIRSFVVASFHRPFINILFGNGIVNQKVYSDFFDKDCLSHNSYVDCLYNFGIIGFLIVIKYLLSRTIKNRFLNFEIKNNKYCRNIKLMRILLLIFAASLSFYTKRMFLIFFLL